MIELPVNQHRNHVSALVPTTSGSRPIAPRAIVDDAFAAEGDLPRERAIPRALHLRGVPQAEGHGPGLEVVHDDLDGLEARRRQRQVGQALARLAVWDFE